MAADIFIFRWVAQGSAPAGGVIGAGYPSPGTPDAAHPAPVGGPAPPIAPYPGEPSVSRPTAAVQRQAGALSAQLLVFGGLMLADLAVSIRQTMGLFLGSTHGCLTEDLRFQRSRRMDHGRFASPAAFRGTLPSTVAAELAIAFGLQGPLLVYAGGAASGVLAIIRAVRWLEAGAVPLVLAGAADDEHGDGVRLLRTTPAGAQSTAYPRRGSGKILLVLLGRAEALPTFKPVAKIGRAELRASSRRSGTDTDHSVAALRSALRHPGTRAADIRIDAGLGACCRLTVLRP